MIARLSSVARGQFYYGWVIVAIGFTSLFMINGMYGYGMGLFLKPMSEELGWSQLWRPRARTG